MNHITQTIETLRESVNRAQATIDFLTQFQAGVDGSTSPPTGIVPGLTPPERTTGGNGAQPPIEESRRAPRPAVPRRTAKQRNRPGGYQPRKIKPPTPINPAPLGAALATLEKPDTVGGAMKYCIRTIYQFGPFTGEDLRAKLQADVDFAKLLGEYGSAVAQNLTYWTKQDYLSRNGETPLESTYTVTATGKEWFMK